MIARYDRPWFFYVWATAIPWALWFVAAWTSQTPQWALATTILGVLGLAAPLGVVAWLTRGDPALRRDILRRLPLRGVHPLWIVAACGLLPAAVFLATALSIPLGYSTDQFLLRGSATFTTGLMSGWIVLVLAPILEELAWHSYGTDTLRRHFTVFTTSMIFAVLWALWHLPLAFIDGSSQNQTAGEGLWHALNFPLSMIPFVLFMNWIYYRSGRNITVTILFHLAGNLITQVFATHPDTELIVTGLLLVATVVLLLAERRLFFSPPPAAVR